MKTRKSQQQDYVHGYTETEHTRLLDQSRTLTDLLHHDTHYPAGAKVLEAGCGVGGQTVILAKRSPRARFTSIDVSEESLAAARRLVAKERLANVTVETGDILHLQFAEETFDHVFVCFVLEHLPKPLAALQRLRAVLKTGGTLTAIEGDHGSTLFFPRSGDAWRTIQCLIDLQAKSGGNALIGRELFPLLSQAGFRDVRVSPRMVYVDASKPDFVDGFTKKTYIAMVEGVRREALRQRLIDAKTWEKGIADLHRAAEADGTFCYTFFKGLVKK